MTSQLELGVEPVITMTEGYRPFCGGEDHYYEYHWKGGACRTYVGPGLHRNGHPLKVAMEVDDQVRERRVDFAVACLAGLEGGRDRSQVAAWLGFPSWEALVDHLFRVLEEEERHRSAMRRLCEAVRFDLCRTADVG